MAKKTSNRKKPAAKKTAEKKIPDTVKGDCHITINQSPAAIKAAAEARVQPILDVLSSPTDEKTKRAALAAITAVHDSDKITAFNGNVTVGKDFTLSN